MIANDLSQTAVTLGAGLAGLLDAERSEHALVDGVVEEQHLARLDDEAREGQQARLGEEASADTERVAQQRDDRGHAEESGEGEQEAEDSGGEFVDQHLEAVLFLGGWRGPASEWTGWLWTVVKALPVAFLILWIRVAWPRVREDQLQRLAWLGLVPVALAQLALTAVVVVAR